MRGGRLGRPADQRKALLRALTTECIRHGAITTTLTKCKEVRKDIDHMVSAHSRQDQHPSDRPARATDSSASSARVRAGRREAQAAHQCALPHSCAYGAQVTLAKDGSLHARRQALGFMYDKQLVHALFEGVSDLRTRCAPCTRTRLSGGRRLRDAYARSALRTIRREARSVTC